MQNEKCKMADVLPKNFNFHFAVRPFCIFHYFRKATTHEPHPRRRSLRPEYYIAAAGGAACCCRRFAGGVADVWRYKDEQVARECISGRSTWASRTSTSRTITARRPAMPSRVRADHLRDAAARADHQLQGRLPDVARAVRRVGLAKISHRKLRSVAEADGRRIFRHLLFPSARSRHAARGNAGGAGHARQTGQGDLRRREQLQRGTVFRSVRIGAAPTGRRSSSISRTTTC